MKEACPVFKDRTRCSGIMQQVARHWGSRLVVHGVPAEKCTERFFCPVCGHTVRREWGWVLETELLRGHRKDEKKEPKIAAVSPPKLEPTTVEGVNNHGLRKNRQ